MGLAAAPVAFALTSGIVSAPLAATNSSFGLAQAAPAPTKDQRDDRGLSGDSSTEAADAAAQDPTSTAAADPAAVAPVAQAAGGAAAAGRPATAAPQPPRRRTVTVTIPGQPDAPTTSTAPHDSSGSSAPPADVPTSTGTYAHEPHDPSEPPEAPEPPEPTEHESDD